MKKTLTVLNILALLMIFSLFGKEVALPRVAAHLYEAKYKELMFQCDNVMRDHFIAKSEVLAAPSAQTIKKLHAAEVRLLTCHEYDVLRKKLIGFGIDENQLARIGLEVIEEQANDVHTFVQTHEIRY